ncbi:MAG: hypothetical protein NTU83_01775, partial [Candidatus Hydrogenedentes bacterium]|nr:hypothetical protein [Candidatus Hydrogenedentota bacterium]
MLIFRPESKLAQPQHQAAFVENTHHDALAVTAGQRADAQVHHLAGEIDLDASVLWQALFRDVHVGQDLQARENGGLRALRRQRHLLHHAIDPVTQLHVALAWFEVNIARPKTECVHDNIEHVPHDRAVIVILIQAWNARGPTTVHVHLADAHTVQADVVHAQASRRAAQRTRHRT